MSKTNQVENKIKELGGGEFQKLVDHYVTKKFRVSVNSTGAVAGANKTHTGTPDALVLLDSGRYLFYEHSTQTTGLRAKFEDDIEKCLDESKTGISPLKIERIFLCTSTDLSARDIEELRKHTNSLAAQYGVHQGLPIEIITRQAIAKDLVAHYPAIAKDHLGVSVDTGQILSPNDFILRYGRNAFAAPLSTSFRFRRDELANILQDLENRQAIIVHGPPGVGKTRLALEACNTFAKEHADYRVRCIFNLGADIFDDLTSLIAEPGNLLILVDDANRIPYLKQLVYLAVGRESNDTIKVVLTVRGYALSEVKQQVQSALPASIYEIGSLGNDSIKSLVREEFDIKNSLYLTRIAKIANGNPRIAIMAAKIASERSTLESISDISDVYHMYFQSVREDISALTSRRLLRVAGMIAFFNTLDRHDQEQMLVAEKILALNGEEIWSEVEELHRLELVDIHDGDIVRVSDQVLATYIAYLSVFLEQALDFGVMLRCLFPRYHSKFIAFMNSLLSAFDSERICECMAPCIRSQYRQERTSRSTRAFSLVKHFWFVMRTEALQAARDHISAQIGTGTDVRGETQERDDDLAICLLGRFAQLGRQDIISAVKLLMRYAEGVHERADDVIGLLTKEFSFRHDSYRYGFYVQHAVIDCICQIMAGGGGDRSSTIAIAVATRYLGTHFESFESERNAATFWRFNLPAIPPLLDLRRKCWRILIENYQVSSFRRTIEQGLYRYAREAHRNSDTDVIRFDSNILLPFLDLMDGRNFLSALCAHQCLDLFEACGVEIPPQKRVAFCEHAFSLFLLFSGTRRLLRYREYSMEARSAAVDTEIRRHFASFDARDYVRAVGMCTDIARSLVDIGTGDDMSGCVNELLLDLLRKNIPLFRSVIGILSQEGVGGSMVRLPVARLIKVVGVDETWRTIQDLGGVNLPVHSLDFFRLLGDSDITPEHLTQLCELLATIHPENLRWGLGFLAKYERVQHGALKLLLQTLLRRARKSADSMPALAGLFVGDMTVEIIAALQDDIAVLKELYLWAIHAYPHQDGKNEIVNYIIDRDSRFVREYVRFFWETEGRHRSISDEALLFIWSRSDARLLADEIVDLVVQEQRSNPWVGEEPIDRLLLAQHGRQVQASPTAVAARDQYVVDLIRRRSEDAAVMVPVFRAIAELSDALRRECLAVFLQENKDVDDFRRLELVSSWTSGCGEYGMMHAFQAKADFLETLLPLTEEVDLIDHRAHLEEQISYERESARREGRRAFKRHG